MPATRYAASYRLFAFLAVGSAIAAVAWAIGDITVLVVGILGHAAGHYYSWRQRNVFMRRRQVILRSTILLFFMVLTVFLGGDIIVTGLSDRLLLSRYLIYGLVIGSFDLMWRRNVVASLVLGGLLLVLISEFALDLWFLAFLLPFVVLALVAVALGRMEGEANQAVLVGGFSWLGAGRFWLSFAAGALLVSALFFFFMPRLASGQFAQASWLPSRLDLSLRGLTMLPGKPSASVAPGIFPSLQGRGADGDHATLGYVGSAADEPVMHVRSRVSSYWRGLVLDIYDGRGWLNASYQIRLIDRSRREYIFPDSSPTLAGRRIYWQTYYLLTDQPNAVFTGYRPGRIYLPVVGPVLLESGSLYRSLSVMPDLQPDRLRLDQAVAEDSFNLVLPFISERTAALAESIVRGAPTDYDKAARLERFLMTNYPYDLNVGPLPPGRDAVDYFLFEQQAGYCAHFATAMAVMARHTGLPARVAAGYLPGYIDTLTGAHIVRVGDAHAWVEIYFQEHGWVAFDPTPRPDANLGFASRGGWLHFGFEDYTGVSLVSVVSPLVSKVSIGKVSVSGWIWLVILAGIIMTIAFALFYRRRGKRKAKTEIREYSRLDGEARRLALRLYSKMVAILAKKGFPPRPPHQSLYEYAVSVCARVPDAREAIDWMTGLASRAAYDPVTFEPSSIAEAKEKLAELKRSLS
jgi:transglutaminase-like putative cysteine protease